MTGALLHLLVSQNNVVPGKEMEGGIPGKGQGKQKEG